MTYCCGILVRDGLVMIGDTRTNAGLDNISTFRKLHVFRQPGERIMALATSGNLSLSQSVISILSEGSTIPTARRARH
jgi:putative proteasome-type protease